MLNFLKRNGSDDVAKFDTVVRDADGPTPPFRMEFAPGVIVIDAEIRDRASLDVFVAALQAMGALLPNALPPPVEIPEAKPADAIRTIDLTPKASDPAPVTGSAPLADVLTPG